MLLPSVNNFDPTMHKILQRTSSSLLPKTSSTIPQFYTLALPSFLMTGIIDIDELNDLKPN
jgi:hypothetical protein